MIDNYVLWKYRETFNVNAFYDVIDDLIAIYILKIALSVMIYIYIMKDVIMSSIILHLPVIFFLT